jgi:hypothetical protein
MSSLQKYNFINIAGASDKLVQRGAGTLHTLVINTTAASGIVIYDGTATGGTKIATIAASPVIGSTFTFDASFATGLFVSVGGASDITLSFGL